MKFFFLFIVLSGVLWLEPALGMNSNPQTIRLQTVQTDFTQEKHLKILLRPLISRGRFVFQPPDSLRWEYKTPVRSILLMHRGGIKKFIAKQGRLEEEKGMQLDAMQVVLTEISNWLDGRFTENKAFATTVQDDQTVLLTPKDEGMRTFIRTIELKLGRKEGVLDAVTIFEGPDAFTRLEFSNAVLNQPVPETLFTKP